MRRLSFAVSLTALFILAITPFSRLLAGSHLGIAARTVATVTSGLTWTTGHVVQTDRLRLPDFRRVFGRRSPTRGMEAAQTQTATLQTDKQDYHPYDQVLVTGTGWLEGEVVELTFEEIATDPPGGWNDGPFVFYATAQPDGTILNGDFYTDIHDGGVIFRLTAHGTLSGLTAQTTFKDSAADIDQCQNGKAGDPPSPCNNTDPADWANGNLGASKSHFFEGDSIPYRMVMSGLATSGTHTVTFAWDTSDSGKHAIDYLTTYNRTVTTADPCAGITGCGSPSTFPIATDPGVTAGQNGTINGFPPAGDDIHQISGVYTLFGGTITGVSTYFVSSTNKCDPSKPAPAPPNTYLGSTTTCVTVSFNTTIASPVLAWAGHVATRADWGLGNSAITINGSPYHMRLIDLDGGGGNQDLSLSADAVFFPAALTVTKVTEPAAAPTTTFGFTTTGSFAPIPNGASTTDPTFSLTPPGGGGSHSDSITYYLQDTTARTVTESDPSALTPPFKLTDITCSQVDSGLGTSSITTSTSSTPNISFSPKEGELITCTLTNSALPHLTVNKVVNPSSDTGRFNLQVNGVTRASNVGDGGTTGSQVANIGSNTFGETQGTNTSLGDYITEIGGAGCVDGLNGSGTITLNAGDDVTCTITNTRKPRLTVTKLVVPASDTGRFDLKIDSTIFTNNNTGYPNNGSTGAQVESIGQHTVSEAAHSGTDINNYIQTFGGACDANGNVTLAAGDNLTCTITNTRKARLTVTKTLSPSNDGGKFDLKIDSTVFDNSGAGYGDGGSTGAQVVATGSHTVSELGHPGTTLGNYTPLIGGDCAADGSITLAAGDNKTCSITNTRKTHTVKLIKTLVPSNDPGKFNLTAAGTTANDQGDGGFAQNTGVAVGTTSVSVSEAAGTGTNLANYTSSLSCVGVSATGTNSASFTMPDNDVTCTVTNTRKTHKVRLTKSLSPTSDPGVFDLTAATVTTNNQGNNGFAEDASVPVGATNVAVSEAAGASTSLGNYTSSLSCTGVTATGTTSASFTMPDNDVSCTVTNTRKTHKVRLTKSLSPTNDPGVFNLTAATVTANNQGNNGFAEDAAVPVGSTNVTVSEAAGASTSLANYTSSLSCDNNATGTTSASFTMPDNDVSCTVTNTRKTHKVTLTKALVPSNDPGKFNLTAAGTTASDQGNGGLAQNTSVAVGSTGVSVSEAAGTATDLANYTSSLSCDNGATGTTSASFTMPDADVSCTVTNTRKTHKVTLTKALVPSNDPGLFNLTAAGTTASDQGNGGSAQNTSVAVGSTGVNVSEAAGSGTNLANYTSSLSCDNGATGTISASFTMPDADVNCTVTNTRKTHKVTLSKALVPSNDPGKFNLTAAGTTANDQGNGGSAQNASVAVGTTNVSVSEAAGTATDLANYTSSLSCTGVSATGTTSASFTMPDADVSCTVTNTRKTHKVTLTKVLSPNTDPGRFDLTAAGTTVANQGDTGSAQNTSVAVGTTNVTVNEIANAANGANLTNYTTNLTCSTAFTAGGGPGTTSGSFTMPDADVSCTITNTRKSHTLTVKKTLVPAADPGKFDLSIGGTIVSGANGVGDGGSGSAAQTVGATSTINEGAHAGTTAAYYTMATSLVCTKTGDASTIVSATGSMPATFTSPDYDVTCTYTNTRKTHQVKLTKSLVPTNDPGLFNLSAAGQTATDRTNGGFAINTAVAVGTTNVNVAEVKGTSSTTTLADYVSSLSCTGVSATGTTSTTFTMPDNDVNCIVTNARLGKAQVVKTVNPGGATPPAAFNFDLREGANSTTSAGTVLATGSVNGTTGGTINFNYGLVPGNHYQICEQIVTPGWFSTLPGAFALYNPGGVNIGEMCTDFVAVAGQTTSIAVNNFYPSTSGFGSTIGFWKNWASCSGSNGGQLPKLDQTLAVSETLAPPPYGQGITIGTLTMHGSTQNRNQAPDCWKAVDLLNKSTVDQKSSKKMASDPAFNLAAQLLGAILNADAGAAMCTADKTVVNYADTLLAKHGFNGSATYAAFTAAETALANTLATLLDQYNNDLHNGVPPQCPTLPTLPPIAPLISALPTSATFKIGTGSSQSVGTVTIGFSTGFPFPPSAPPTYSLTLGGSPLPAGVTASVTGSGTTATLTLTYNGSAAVAGTVNNIQLIVANSTGGTATKTISVTMTP